MKNEEKTLGENDLSRAKKDFAEEEIKTAGEALIELIPFVGGIISASIPNIYSFKKKRAFTEYLYGINKVLMSTGLTDEECSTFSDKIDDDENYAHLSTIIDSVFFSKSRRARVILGVITANYICSETLPYEELIIVAALKELLDEDIDSFLTIYDVAKNGGREDSNGEGAFFLSYYPEKIQINTAFSKLKQLNIFGSKAESLTSKSPASWHGNVTSITEKLKYYVDLCEQQ